MTSYRLYEHLSKMDYYQVNIKVSPKQPWEEILMQDLASLEFDSFVEAEDELQAFIRAELYDEEKLNNLIASYKDQEVVISKEKIFIPSQNWNAEWEADYPTVEIDKDLIIRAPFHSEQEEFKLSIEIQPQMSFGTGHHQTTYLLCKTMLGMDFASKEVLDVGTGTGVLGILANLLGAKEIVGTDIEEGAVENAIENCERNNLSNFKIVKGDIDVVPKKEYDVILANINKNVLLSHLPSYSTLLKQGGTLLLSGFFETDTPELIQAAKKLNLLHDETYTQENWAVLQLKKQ